VPNWCVATAASADAYGSGTAATKWSYRARAVPCRTTEVIFCDLDVLGRAPRNLFLAGLGDLLAKFFAFLDWNVASLVTGEYYCAETAAAALGSASRAIEAAGMESSDASGAVRSLTDAAVTSSFAMQAVGYSRPAASAEHSVGHYWEISHSADNPERELHGMLVGLASRVTLAGYADFYAALPAFQVGDARIEARLASLEGSAPWQDVVEEGMRPYRRWLAEETDLGLYNRETVRTHLERYRGSRDQIEKLSRVLLGELESAIRVLEAAGYPFRLGDYGLSVEQAFLPFRYTRGLRNRYSSFGLMHVLGVEGRILETIRHELESLS
jgi:glycerol-1-phosphate dehydrogenase [NAD(P)+]